MPASPVPPAPDTPSGSSDVVRRTEGWFVRRGLPYFVPAERKAARDALSLRALLPTVVLAGLAAVGLAVLFTAATGDPAYAPATLTFIGFAAAALYALVRLRARPILTWGVRRTLGSLRQLLPMVTRALPLLLIFVTFLFINAEVWQVAAQLDGAVLWLTVVLFTAMGVAFFLVRLPEEIDRADDELTADRIATVCRETPLAQEAVRLAEQQPEALEQQVAVSRYERINLTVALLIIQTSQVVLMALTVFGFFMVFGAIAMQDSVMQVWVGGRTHHLDGLENVSVELFQVSVFLSAFSGLYFTVTAVTDDTFRSQFFTDVMGELERAIAARAVYTVLRHERGEDDGPAATAGPRGSDRAAPDDATLPLAPLEDDRPG
jgi:hypothetical protein